MEKSLTVCDGFVGRPEQVWWRLWWTVKFLGRGRWIDETQPFFVCQINVLSDRPFSINGLKHLHSPYQNQVDYKRHWKPLHSRNYRVLNWISIEKKNSIQDASEFLNSEFLPRWRLLCANSQRDDEEKIIKFDQSKKGAWTKKIRRYYLRKKFSNPWKEFKRNIFRKSISNRINQAKRKHFQTIEKKNNFAIGQWLFNIWTTENVHLNERFIDLQINQQQVQYLEC